MLNWRKFFVQAAVFISLLLVAMFFFLPSARADGPPPSEEPAPTSDPYFREEAPPRMVECADNVFVPLGEGGTWECPSPDGCPEGQGHLAGVGCVAPQHPEEVIGRVVDGPYGETCVIVDVYGNMNCNLPDGPSEPTPTVEPLPECTDPMVECSCDHYIGGCTGGNPPDGEGTPFPKAEDASSAAPEQEQAFRMDPVEMGLAAVGLILVAAGTLYMIFRRQPE